jgi:hypothetical protein
MESNRIEYTRSTLFHKPKVYKEFIKGKYYGFDEFIERELGVLVNRYSRRNENLTEKLENIPLRLDFRIL